MFLLRRNSPAREMHLQMSHQSLGYIGVKIVSSTITGILLCVCSKAELRIILDCYCALSIVLVSIRTDDLHYGTPAALP